MWNRIHKKTIVVFLGLILLIAITAGVVSVSLMKCAGSLRRSYHTIVLGDKNYVEGRFRVQGHGTSLLSSGRLGGFTTLRSSDCVNVIVLAEDQVPRSKAKEERERRIGGPSKLFEKSLQFNLNGETLGEGA